LVCLVATMRSQLVWAATGSLITLLITWIIPDQRVPPVVVAPAAGGELEASRGRVCMTNDELTVSLKFLCMPCDASLCVSWVCCVRMPACHRSNRARGWPLCQTACVLRVSAAVGSRCCFVRSGHACHLGVVVCALFQQSCQPQQSSCCNRNALSSLGRVSHLMHRCDGGIIADYRIDREHVAYDGVMCTQCDEHLNIF
jgi:hypothetical protein